LVKTNLFHIPVNMPIRNFYEENT